MTTETYIIHALWWYVVGALSSGVLSGVAALALFLPKPRRYVFWNAFYGGGGLIGKMLWASTYYYVPFFSAFLILTFVLRHDYWIPSFAFLFLGYLQGFVQIPRTTLFLNKENEEGCGNKEQGHTGKHV